MASVPATLPVWMQQPIAASVPSISAKQQRVRELRQQLFANGFRYVAANKHKQPLETAWGDKARALTAEIIASQTPDPFLLNSGILCDGLLAVDIDIDDAALVAQIRSLARLHLGSGPERSRENTARTLLLYRAANGLPKHPDQKGVNDAKIQLLGQGIGVADQKAYQFIADGKLEDGSRYTWDHSPAEFTRDQLTVVSAESLAAFLADTAPLIGAEKPAVSGTMTEVITGQGPVMDALQQPTADDLAYCQTTISREREKYRALRNDRNIELCKLAKMIGNFIPNYRLDHNQIYRGLMDDAAANGYIAAKGQNGAELARKTIQHNLQEGATEPRTLKSGEAARLAAGIDMSAVLATVNTMLAKGKEAPKQGQTVLLGGKDIVPRSVDWLWKGYLPNGMLTMFAGLGGTGKSTIACSFAATVTTGGVWPDETRCSKPGHVLFWSSEETPEYSIAPRMMAMGANADRYSIIRGTQEDGATVRQFDAARDMESLKAAVQSIGGISLLIIDPILSAVVGDTNKATDVRRSLQPIVEFAEECKCAVLCISHFAKGTAGRRPEERTLGSSAYKDLPRIVLSAGQEEGSPHCVFTRTKSNISATGGGFSYTLEQHAFAYGMDQVETTRIAWGEALEGSARSILAEVEAATEDDGSAVSKARQLLLNLLAQGPRYATEVQDAAKELNISSATLRRAREALKIVIERDKGFHAKVRWNLPFDPNAIAQIGSTPIGRPIGGIPWEHVQ